MQPPAAASDLAPLPAPPAWLLVEARALELPFENERRNVDREPAALILDRLLARVARGYGALELAIGEALAALTVGDRLLQLGYGKLEDYARERLDVRPRTAQAMVRLARALRDRPLLRAAVHSGEISARKAQRILPFAVGDAEAEWVARARTSTVRALEAAAVEARAGAGEGAADEERWEIVDAALPPEGREVVNRALSLAGDLLGTAAPRWQRVEAMCEEFLGAHPVEPDPADDRGEPLAPSALAAIREACEQEMNRWEWLDALHADDLAPWVAVRPEGEARGTGGPVAAPVPGSAEGPYVDPLRVNADVLRLAAMRAGWDGLLGHLATILQWCGLWRDMGFESLDHWASERLGMSGATLRQRTALERRLYSLPELAVAFRAGRIPYEKARLVASVATEATESAWLAQAGKSTVIALRRLVEADEERQMCARRELAWRVPEAVASLVRTAFRAARAAEKRWLTPGECLVRVAAHFVATYEGKLPKRRTRSAKTLARDGGLCQVPGCSRAAAHSHHVVLRSAGGSDEQWNRTSTCPPHHLHGIHAGYVRVTGRAPDRLRWELGRGWDGAPLEVFEPPDDC